MSALIQKLRDGGRGPRYAAAVGATLVGAAITAAVHPLLPRVPSTPLFATIVIVAWLAGFGPAAVATVLAVVVLEYLGDAEQRPLHVIDGDASWLFLFALVTLAIAGLASSIRRLQRERDGLLDRERQARGEAEAANRAKDDFLAIVSHELRTPITTILGWVHILRRGTLGPTETEQALVTIERSSVLQAKLIDDLLEVSRAVAGKLSVVMRRVRVAELVADAVHGMRPKADAQGVTILTSVEGDLHVLGDPERLEQVLVNLLSNAIKFTPPAGQVRIAASPDEGWIRLTVADTGEGIHAAVLPHIFERFHQGQPGLRRREGLGLGLAITKHIVDVHGGWITAESAGEGQGATFVVRLPRDG